MPLLIAESASAFCRRFWDEADSVITSRLLYVEAVAALVQGERLGRLNRVQHRAALDLVEEFWREFNVVEADDVVVRRAAELAQRCALRGCDAVHVTSAEQADEGDLVVAAGDGRLLRACGEIGMATADIRDR